MNQADPPDDVSGPRARLLPLRTFQRRLIWLCMLPLVLLSIFLGVSSIRAARDRTDDQAADLVKNIAFLVDQNLGARINALNSLGNSPLIGDASRSNELYEKARLVRATFGSDVVLAEVDGQMLFSTRLPLGSPLPKLPRPSGTAAVPIALATGKPAVGDTFLGPIAKVPLIAIAVPVIRDSKPQFILLMTVEARQFQDLLAVAALPAGWQVALVDSKNVAIADRSLAEEPAPGNRQGGYFTAKPAASPWVVALYIPSDQYRSPLLAATQILVMFIVAAIAVGLLGGSLAARKLSRSVKALAGEPSDSLEEVEIEEIALAKERLERSGRERELALSALKNSEATFRTMFAGMSDGVILATPDRRVIMVNPGFATMFGCTAEEVIGRSSESFYADVSDHRRVIRDHVTDGPSVGTAAYQMRYRRTDGSEFWADTRAVRISDANGEPLALIGVLRDMTERLQADALQRETNERFAKVFRLSPVGIFIGQIPSLQIVDVNPAFERLLGFDRDELVGERVERLRLWVDQDLQPAAAGPLDGEAMVRAFDTRLRTKSGEIIDVAYAECRVDIGSAPHFIGMVFDITAQKQAIRSAEENKIQLEALVGLRTAELETTQEELARRADEAETANRAKSQFLANMSHEIRTPLNAIIGLAHLLGRATLDSVQQDRVAKIGTAGQHLLQVINDILDLSKIEAGMMRVDSVDFSLDAVIEKSFELVSDRANAKGLELIVYTDDLPDRLRGDAVRLSQALINLLANAVKFTDSGWVRLRGRSLAEDAKRVLIRFEVQDTGPGIAPERQVELFKPFEQADPTTSRRHGGTGLGLALTRHIAEMMHGQAGVDSTLGSGSTFWFTAWIDRGSAAFEQLPTAVRLHDLRALLVDDLPEARKALEDRLHLLGMKVDVVASGPDALRKISDELASGRSYHVLLVDWRMAPMDGIETLTRARELLGEEMPPSILVTAFDHPDMWSQSQTAQCGAVLIKPVTASALRQAVSRVLGKSVTERSLRDEALGQEEAKLKRDHRGQRVLLAEDNPVNREVAEELLRSVGLTIESAVDGERALDLALSREYDLILLDLQMPGKDGFEVARAIRTYMGPSTPIVAMTANAFAEDRAACLDAGMNDHVAKPVNPEILYSTLLRWLPVRGTSLSSAHHTTPIGLQLARDLRSRLAVSDDLDFELALSQVGGRLETLERVLRSFVELYPHSASALLSGPSSDCREQWRTACHSVRGACATLGARQLNRQIQAFERDLAQTADVDLLAPAAAELYRKLSEFVHRLKAQLAA